MIESAKPEFSARKFAKLFNRHHSTISRELKRNSATETYHADCAIHNAIKRRRRYFKKLDLNPLLWNFIIEAIRCLWSPEQISNRLKSVNYTNLDKTMSVSHTTIYATIRALPKGELKKDLLSCLRGENKKRRAAGTPEKGTIL